ncbi:5'-3' exonuclease H3TH domain-containing protein [Tissierella sp. MB52-C2]|uniref:5'-3' exonuclease n=1 Tax=Tissierella sp. MB52-C2 TaxID=3070999 RepID=UPI00280C2464|nr:5'-3' exonuclease H3TH domain-containing protein [Tissierella sp. MB52-C2]WMM23801.1 5'-3' exonuclease H3TH domain-containing protein [Tissierella sp. MB52-C2]
MERLLLVDGHNLLFQMFYGIPARILGKDNKPIHAIVGFLGALLKIIKNIEPSNIVVIFDGESGSDRVEINPEYKANRMDYTDIEESDNPFSQLEDIMKSLGYIDIRYFETTNGFEADDVIASYVKMYREKMKIFIVSNDTDFLQLVDKNVSLYVYRGKNTIIYDEEKVFQRYGVKSALFADYKALIGDKSDNLKGVPKVGPKTATKLINQYGGVHNILENLTNIQLPSIKTTLNENITRVKVNLDLIKLTGNAPLPFLIDDTIYNYNNEKSATMKILKDTGII